MSHTPEDQSDSEAVWRKLIEVCPPANEGDWIIDYDATEAATMDPAGGCCWTLVIKTYNDEESEKRGEPLDANEWYRFPGWTVEGAVRCAVEDFLRMAHPRAAKDGGAL